MMATSSCSEAGRPARRRGAGIRRSLPLLLLPLASLACGPRSAGAQTEQADRTERTQPAPPRYAGEHALWVEDRDSVIHAAWLTPRTGAGRLEVVVDGSVRFRRRTPQSQAHGVSFPRPRAELVTLRYGRDDARESLHRTEILLPPPRRAGEVTFPAVDSLFVVGDAHGSFDRLVAVLRNAGVIDADTSWAAGSAHLVFLGDLMDRGEDATALLWFVYRLEREAEREGGRVHVALGNHEIMVMTGDVRYVAQKERNIAFLHGIDYARLYDPRRSILGRWLASKPAAIRIGDVLLAHGGVAPALADVPLRTLEDSLAAFMDEELFVRWTDTTYVPPLDSAGFARRWDAFWSDESVFWFRGYVRSDTLADGLARVLSDHGARLHVVAHTQGPTIRSRYDGSLIATNTDPPANEVLLLLREDGRLARYRYGATGPPSPVPADTVPADTASEVSR